jgi:hypothetical protein
MLEVGALVALSRCQAPLTHLDLSGNFSIDDQAASRIERLPDSLVELDLRETGVGAQGYERLRRVFPSVRFL